MSLCLSRAEIAQLTRAKTRARQLSFLIRNGIRHYVDHRGWPVVPRSAVEGLPMQDQERKPSWKPSKAA